MPLTDTTIRSAKAPAKTFKLFDGGGLYLEVSPAGGKWWRWKYRFGGKEKRLSFGVYPDVSLKAAREKRDDARQQLAAGIDPGQARKAEKLAQAGAESFEAIAREWHAKFSPGWVASHGDRILRRLERDVFPGSASGPSPTSKRPSCWPCCAGSRAGARRRPRTARCRTAGRCSATPWRRAAPNAIRRAICAAPCPHRRRSTTPRSSNRSASRELLRAIDGYEGFFATKCALRLAPLVFVRPGELRKAQWPEIDFGKAEWRIPAERMKMREQHIVPLSRQAVEILRELEPLTNRGISAKPDAPRYVFPAPHRASDR